jgi:hypothetical protein
MADNETGFFSKIDDIKDFLQSLVHELDTTVTSKYTTEGRNSGDVAFNYWKMKLAAFILFYIPSLLDDLYKFNFSNDPQGYQYSQDASYFLHTKYLKAKEYVNNIRKLLTSSIKKEVIDQISFYQRIQTNKNDLSLSIEQKILLVGLVRLLDSKLIDRKFIFHTIQSAKVYGQFVIIIVLLNGETFYINEFFTKIRDFDFDVLAEKGLLRNQSTARLNSYAILQGAKELVDNNFRNTNPTLTEPHGSILGSPFGFKDTDWTYVSERANRPGILSVVFGHQFKSDYYNSPAISSNLERHFQVAIGNWNTSHPMDTYRLDFKILKAGYGEHLFNEIARDIISSDIAVFETSDLNPNVMIELGVALTWGKKVLPIKQIDRPEPPSDISGQTWANYERNAEKFIDGDFNERMDRLIQRVVTEKSI